MNFEGKVVLVTGASSGVGAACAIQFARCGAKLSLVGRNEQCLREVAMKCERERGYKPLPIVADLSTDEGCERGAKETLKHFGRLDVLVNNAAAVVGVSVIEKADMSTFDDVFNINVRGVYNLTRLLVPALVASKGNIINVSSIVGTMCHVGYLPYCMAKAAIDHFTRLVALELAPKGVRVNAVSPGISVGKYLTRLPEFPEELYSVLLENYTPKIPLRKVCQPEHVAKMILYLASGDGELVTGTVVPVDGGMRLA